MDESGDGDQPGEEETDREGAVPDAADAPDANDPAPDDANAVPSNPDEDTSSKVDADSTEDGETDADSTEDGETDAESGVDSATDADSGTDTDTATGDTASEPDWDLDESEADPAEPEWDDPLVEEDSEDGADAADVTADAVSEEDSTPLDRKTSGPSQDQEQPLAEHIEEMVKRLGIVIVVAGLVSVVVFPYGEEIINFLWYSVLPGTDVSQPHVYHPLELLLTQLKVASLAGLIVALPVFVYETYAFMRPGLYPHERRYYLAAVPTSLVLAFVGVTFAYFIVLPAVMSYFLYYSQDVVQIAFALGQTFDLILLLMGYLAIVFQIPLFIMLAIMMGLTSRQWLADRRLIFWGAFAGISFLFSPDPTGMAPAIVAATMILLFEGTLLLLRWTGR